MENKKNHDEDLESEQVNPMDEVETDQDQETFKLDNTNSHYKSAPKLNNLPINDPRFLYHARAIMRPENTKHDDSINIRASETMERSMSPSEEQYSPVNQETDQSQQIYDFQFQRPSSFAGHQQQHPQSIDHQEHQYYSDPYYNQQNFAQTQNYEGYNSSFKPDNASIQNFQPPTPPEDQQIPLKTHHIMIQKYESVLQSLNYEFKSSLDQNKQLQEELNILEQNQAKDRQIIQELNSALYNSEGKEEIQRLVEEKNELKSENERMANQLLEMELQTEEIKKAANDTFAQNSEKYQQSEYFFRAKVDEMMQKVRESQTMAREKDEIIFTVSRENEALKADIRNLESVENALKDEIDDLVSKRKSLEDINQNLKNQICEQNIDLRRLDSANNTLTRENQSLLKNIELYKINTEEILKENNLLKDNLDKIEVSFSDQELVIQQLQSDKEQLKAEVDRVRRNRTLSRGPSRRSASRGTPVRDKSYEKSPLQDSPKPNKVHFNIPSRGTNASKPSFKNATAKSLYEEYIAKMKKDQDVDTKPQRMNQTFDHGFTNVSSNFNQESFGRDISGSEEGNKSIRPYEYYTPQKPPRSQNQNNFEPVHRTKNLESSSGFREALGFNQANTNLNNTVSGILQKEMEINDPPAAGVNSGSKDRTFARLTGNANELTPTRNTLSTLTRSFVHSTHQKEDSLKEIQENLLKFQIEKQQLENEFNRIPQSYKRSFAQREKRDILENKIEEVEKKINETKLFLRKRKKAERERSL
ncbi:unnamed protein product [Moneuplotes crassus]|uniref:Uncharacterized protein n=1 Tax=Euplotes crassus TaxID=5936 RepID=A0AAD1Y8Q2_EUPCR|nr:unnamed protein product [Moneuplotes crassus]